MLIQFSVGNFRSFNQEVLLNLIPTKKDKLHHGHIIRSEETGIKTKALPLAIFYGANASGKSNLVKAMSFAKKLIVKGTRGDQEIGVTPFLLSNNKTDEPSHFEFIFKHKGVLYTYGFKTTKKEIKEEWLFAVFSKKEVRLFERISENGKVKIEFGDKFSGTKNDKQRLEFVAAGTRPNQLFLTEAFERNVEWIKQVMNWFREYLVIIFPAAEFGRLILFAQKDIQFKNFLVDILRLTDTGIDNIQINEMEFDFIKNLPDEMSENERQAIQALLDKDPDHHLEFNKKHQFIAIQKKEDGATKFVSMGTQHKRSDGTTVNFDTRDESDGTHRMIHLIPALYDLQSADKLYVIDELDRSLHPLLSRLIIESFLKMIETQKSKGQIILTTHETCLLDLEILRQDEIWFIEKDKENSSQITSLADFNIRGDLKISKGYINGRFGAIPFLGNIEQLFLQGDKE